MRLLVVHGWLTGNLGAFLQTSVLIRALRELKPTALDLCGYPAVPGQGARELLHLVDGFQPEPLHWSWTWIPKRLRAAAFEPSWYDQRAHLFARYDAIVSAPGAILVDRNPRCASAVCDLEVAGKQRVPVILGHQSVGPLTPDQAAALRNVTLSVARDGGTHKYLTKNGVASVASSDLATLYPYADHLATSASPRRVGLPYRALFLSSDNLAASVIGWRNGALMLGTRSVFLAPTEQILLATADGERDGHFLARLAKKLELPSIMCRTPGALVALIADSAGVISDETHPALCALALGKPADLLSNRWAHEDPTHAEVLRADLRSSRNLARRGLDAILSALRGLRAKSEGTTR